MRRIGEPISVIQHLKSEQFKRGSDRPKALPTATTAAVVSEVMSVMIETRGRLVFATYYPHGKGRGSRSGTRSCELTCPSREDIFRNGQRMSLRSTRPRTTPLLPRQGTSSYSPRGRNHIPIHWADAISN